MLGRYRPSCDDVRRRRSPADGPDGSPQEEAAEPRHRCVEGSHCCESTGRDHLTGQDWGSGAAKTAAPASSRAAFDASRWAIISRRSIDTLSLYSLTHDNTHNTPHPHPHPAEELTARLSLKQRELEEETERNAAARLTLVLLQAQAAVAAALRDLIPEFASFGDDGAGTGGRDSDAAPAPGTPESAAAVDAAAAQLVAEMRRIDARAAAAAAAAAASAAAASAAAAAAAQANAACPYAASAAASPLPPLPAAAM